MKTVLRILILLSQLLIASPAATNTPNNYLVIKIVHLAYPHHARDRLGHKSEDTEVKQSFKIPLTDEFMANFKNLPRKDSEGTGFCCSGGNLKGMQSSSTGFAWWIQRTGDNRWAINMWGKGEEMVNGVKINFGNPGVSQCVTVKRWEDIDMDYMISYIRDGEGVNVAFSAKFVAANDAGLLDSTPVARVLKADRSTLFEGADTTGLPLVIGCLFQEN